MSSSVFSGEPMQPKNRTEEQILERLRKELKRGRNILQGGVMLADVQRLRLSDDLEIQRAVEELVRRAERKFGHGHKGSQRQGNGS